MIVWLRVYYQADEWLMSLGAAIGHVSKIVLIKRDFSQLKRAKRKKNLQKNK